MKSGADRESSNLYVLTVPDLNRVEYPAFEKQSHVP